MIELPEAVNLARQLEARFKGCTIASIVTGASPHKFAWYYGDRDRFTDLAVGATFRSARAVGGMVEGTAGDVKFLFSEGANLRHLHPGARVPGKHQFLMTFDNGSALVVSVQMYGGMGVFRKGTLDNPYYKVSQEKPSPLSDGFDAAWFTSLLAAEGADALSIKAFLATEQRVPGLGNGVLQDILFNAGINPRTRMGEVGAAGRRKLLGAITRTLRQMADRGGRDTELDLDGKPGGYRTLMSRTTVGTPCPRCGTTIQKAAYLGGSVYFCSTCQPA